MVTKAQADNLFSVTKDQADCPLWFQHRLGQITSIMHDVLWYTEWKYPKTIINFIMQYAQSQNDIPSLKWGRDNEAKARHDYTTLMETKHKNFMMALSRLVIYSCAALSPDGICLCDCHGTRLLEIKCPYKIRDQSPTSKSTWLDVL